MPLLAFLHILIFISGFQRLINGDRKNRIQQDPLINITVFCMGFGDPKVKSLYMKIGRKLPVLFIIGVPRNFREECLTLQNKHFKPLLYKRSTL
jgi:hypothetical protein